jgi:hypothetical protein
MASAIMKWGRRLNQLGFWDGGVARTMVPQISKHEPDGLRATIGHQWIIKELNMTSIDLNLIDRTNFA